MKRKSNVIKSSALNSHNEQPAEPGNEHQDEQRQHEQRNEQPDLSHNRGWLNPTKCTLRWLGLRPTRLQSGEKTYSLNYDDQAA